MSEYNSLSHTKWDCKYHIVFIPKCRRKVLYGKVRIEVSKPRRGVLMSAQGEAKVSDSEHSRNPG